MNQDYIWHSNTLLSSLGIFQEVAFTENSCWEVVKPNE